MRTIAIINQKGGCGKTTTAINLAAVLARQNQRVLLADLDPQGHCAAGLGIPENRIDLDTSDVLLAAGQRTLDLARLLWRPARNLDVAPARMRLAGLEASRGGLADSADRELRLRKALASFTGNYDLCLVDCPPTIGLLTFNALAAADLVLIPVETSFFSLQGASRQLNTVRSVARRLGVQVPVWVLPTIHDAGNAVANDLLDELFKRFKGRVVPVTVRRDPALREAASFGQSVLDYAPASTGAEDYSRLGIWVAEHVSLPVAEQPVPDAAVDLPEFDPGQPPAAFAPSTPEAATATFTPQAPPAVSLATPELKPVSRAEDVARRAQDFLRRVALSRAPSQSLPSPGTPPPFTGTPLRLMDHGPAKVSTASPTTARILGIRETGQGVLFVQPLNCGDRVSIAGTFNAWSTTTHPMRPNPALGVFELCLNLPPGKYRYRLVIDGLWTADPFNNNCEPNPFGETDSVVTVSAPVHTL